MNYLHINNPIDLFSQDVFKHKFEGAFLVYNPEEVESELNQTSVMDYIEEHFNFSWDGTLYWMNRELSDIFMPFAEEWFQENYKTMQSDMSEVGCSNFLLYAKTPNGCVFIDTQVDINTEIEQLMTEFKNQYKDTYDFKDCLEISDSHLIDNLVFGRTCNFNNDINLKKLFDEDVLAPRVAFCSQEDTYQKISDSGKTIVLTGDFGLPIDEIIEDYIYCFPVSTQITSENCWLWLGENPDPSLIQQAKAMKIQISTWSEVLSYLIIED